MGESPIIDALERQARVCEKVGSAMTGFLIRQMRISYETGGIVRRLLNNWEGDPIAAALGLRLTGGLHFLVLAGRAPALAAFYPNVGGQFSEACWPAAEAAIEACFDIMTEFANHPPQTNEVRRSGVLLGGFLTVARETGLPLRCLEVGASAGLNLNWHRYQYRIGGTRWGDPESPVVLESDWTGPAIPLDTPAQVVESAGCDLKPIDLTAPEAAERMKSYIWPDQPARFAAMTAAIDFARSHPVDLVADDAAAWTTARLQTLPEGVATVLYHSIAAQYFDAQTRDGLQAAITDASRRATPTSPFAHLQMEMTGSLGDPQLRLTLWPGGEDRQLAIVHPHGNFARWVEPGKDAA